MNKLITYLLLFAFLFTGILNGYSQRSSNKKFGEDPLKTEIQLKIDSARLSFDNNPIAAFAYVEAAIILAVNNGYENELAEGYYTLGDFNLSLKEYNTAILHCERALKIYEKKQNWNKAYSCTMILGESHFKLKEYNLAAEYFKQASLLANRFKNTKAIIEADFQIAQCKIAAKKFDEAEQLLDIIKKKAADNGLTDLVAEIDYALAELYERKGELVKATNFYNTAQTNAFQNNNVDLVNRSNKRAVDSYSKGENQDDDNQTINSLNSAEDLFKSEKDTSALLDNTLLKADYYTAQGNYTDAENILNTSYDLSEKYGDLEKQVTTSEKLYNLYAQTNNSPQTKEAYANYNKLSDSLAQLRAIKANVTSENQMVLRTVEKQISNLELERKLNQQTIELLEKEQTLNNESLQQQRTLLYLFAVIFILFIAAAVFVYRNNKAKKRANQLLYLKSLRAQMNPHFIFNSLNSVNNFIATSDERAANKYLSKFSKLMRQVLEYSQVEFISLSKEIEVLALYIELEHERFKDKFDFNFKVDEAINTESYKIPPMLVQPFIENAIWHGLRYRKNGGKLDVLLKNHSNFVEISIKDNGIGRKKSQELKTENQKKHNSSGMKNVENRTEMIKTVFKTKIDYTINDLPNNSGTEVIIKLYHND